VDPPIAKMEAKFRQSAFFFRETESVLGSL
jgi:hypothetical protein